MMSSGARFSFVSGHPKALSRPAYLSFSLILLLKLNSYSLFLLSEQMESKNFVTYYGIISSFVKTTSSDVGCDVMEHVYKRLVSIGSYCEVHNSTVPLLTSNTLLILEWTFALITSRTCYISGVVVTHFALFFYFV